MPPTILIVDDQELIIRIVQSALRPLGAALPAVRMGRDAVRYVEESGVPNAIILDFSMPDQDGVETLRQIRRLATGGAIPVVMLTARDQTLIRKEADGLQVHAFMTKPFSPSALLQTMKEILEGDASVPAH